MRFSCTRALNTALFAVVETQYVLLRSPQVGSNANSVLPPGIWGQPGTGSNTVLSLCIGGHWGRGWRRKRHGETQREAYSQERWWDEVSHELRDTSPGRMLELQVCKNDTVLDIFLVTTSFQKDSRWEFILGLRAGICFSGWGMRKQGQ